MKQRLIWVDSLKGILIVLVVLGHAIQETLKIDCVNSHIWNYIYSFHMPAFMAVSGYLSYKILNKASINNLKDIVNSSLSMLYRRGQQLLVPFFLWALIKILVYQELTIDSITNVFLYPDRSFWFLWVLFFISASYKIIECLSVSLRLDIDKLIITFCVLFTLIMIVAEFRLFGYQFFSYYFLFYSLGYFLHKYNYSFIYNKVIILCFTIIWLVLAWFWNMHELPVFLKWVPLPSSLLQYGFRFITAFVAIIAIWGISPLVLVRKNLCNIPFIHLGKISLGIYVVHQLLIPFIFKIVHLFVSNQSFDIVFTFLLSLTFSWVIVWILGKCSATKRFMLGKVD